MRIRVKNYLAIVLSLMISGSVHAQNYTPVINYNYNGTPTHGVKIKTNLPFQNGHHMPTLIIEGYNYGESKPIGLILNWYIYSNNFYSPGVSSFGAHTPEITLANEGGKVVIFIDHRGYYNRFTVRAFSYGMSDSSTHFQSWTIVDEAISGSNQKVMPYKNAFAGNVGIGTSNPTVDLEVVDSGETNIKAVESTNNRSIQIYQQASDSYLIAGGSTGNYGRLRIHAGGTDRMAITSGGNVGIGTINPDQKLTVAGMVKSRELLIDEDTGADFVFEEDYALPTLSQIETFIKANKHLEGIASAKEMKANGVKVGELQIQLLQKIEELTLHTIAQNKYNKAQQKTLEQQQELLNAQAKLIKAMQEELENIKKGKN